MSSGAKLHMKAPTETVKAKLIVLMVCVFVCALSLRLFFVHEVLLQSSLLYADLNAVDRAGFLVPPDSTAYIRLAKDIFAGYFSEPPDPDALWRTMGYPAFLTPFYFFDLAPAGILVAQAVLGALVSVLTLLAARMFTGSILVAGLAGLFSALSPTGVGLGGLVMNDMLLAFIVAAGLCFLYLGAIKEKPVWIIMAGLAFGGGVIVKPILMLWSLFIIPIYLLFCLGENKPAKWKALGVAVIIQTVVLGLYCTRSYVYEGVFTPSSNINFVLHDYLRPRVEEWVKAGGLPDNRAVRRNRDGTRTLLDEETRGSSTKEKINLMKTRGMQVLGAHPLVTLQVLLEDMKEHALSGWDYFPRQLPLGAFQVGRLSHAAEQESRLRETSLILSTLFFCVLVISTWFRPTANNRKILFQTSALMLTYGYFSVFSGTAFWGGSRIMYPVEIVLILLVVLALQAGSAVCAGMLKKAGIFPQDTSPTVGIIHQTVPWVLALCVLATGAYGSLVIIEKDSETYNKFGMVLARRDSFAESADYFQKALQLDPNNLQARSNLAYTCIRLGKYGDAIPLLRELVQIRPGDANDHFSLGIALANSGNRKESIEYIKEALRLNPNLNNAREALKMLENQSGQQ
jgi:hypothetical protein